MTHELSGLTIGSSRLKFVLIAGVKVSFSGEFNGCFVTTQHFHPAKCCGVVAKFEEKTSLTTGRGAPRTQDENAVTHHGTEIVHALRLAIAERIGNDRFELWFRGAQLGVEGHTVRIATGTQFKLGWLRANLRQDIEAACQAVLGELAVVEFRVDATCQPAPQIATTAPAPINGATSMSDAKPPKLDGQPSASSNPQPRSRRKFAHLESFVAGQTNRVARSSAEMVVSNPGTVSPLFLYGGTGVGKTHLAQGIWTAVRRSPETTRTVYLSAEQFTTYFLQALNGSGLPTFRRRYRHVDLLVIDDIQFFAGKRATIVELQHTIDAVSREGGQLVLTADCSPADLGCLGNEMTNRLTGGLVVRMEAPDREARRESCNEHRLGKLVPYPRMSLI